MRSVRLAPLAALLVLLWIAGGCTVSGNDDDPAAMPDLSGPYLGQTPPGAEPELFAPGIVSTGLFERDLAATPDGMELYYTVAEGNYRFTAIMVTRQVDGRWTAPEVTPFTADPEVRDIEPFITPDGEQFYFLSDRALDGEGGVGEDENIWVMDREGDGWGEPRPLPAPVNTEAPEFFPSVTRDGTIYFTREGEGRADRIFRSRLVNGAYAEPEMLGPEVNGGRAQFNAYVAPDESFVIVPIFGREDSRGATDYYVAFRDDDDVWTGPINLGDRVNTEGGLEYSPFVTPDGKYFFFMAAREGDLAEPAALTMEWLRSLAEEPGNGQPNVYWMDAGFIQDLRPE